MRLFIAVEIPVELRKMLYSQKDNICNGKGEKAGIKWVEEENLHLTLKFLGEVDEGTVDAIKDALKKIRTEHIDSSVSGFGVFPNENYIRVIWAGLEPADKLNDLHDRIDDALASLGFKKDGRFHPHVTLGRVRFVKDKQELVHKLKEMDDAGFGKKFRIDSFKLKKSTLSSSGPVYEDIGVFQLTN